MMSTDPTYPLFSIFAFLGFILPLIPLPWHLRAWNSGTVYYMLWASLACLNQFVNSIVWADNVLNVAPVWCDISIRIIMGASVGLPSASLCINRRLYKIANAQAVSVTRAEKRRAILIDTLICVLWPLIYIALQYIVEGHRFNIYQEIGCYPALYNAIPMYFLSAVWPIVLGLISGTYCILSLRAFVRRRIEFSQFMSSNKSLTMGRYFRLMALATTEVLCTTPLSIFLIWLNTAAEPVEVWHSWSNTHLDYSRVEQFPSVIWRSSHLLVVALEFTRWAAPICSLIFFCFFGFAEEARKHYRLVYVAVRKGLGFPVKAGKKFFASDSSGKFKKPSPSSFSNIAIPSPSLPPYSLPSSPASSSLPAYDAKRPELPMTSRDTISVDLSSLYSIPADSSSLHRHSSSSAASETYPNSQSQYALLPEPVHYHEALGGDRIPRAL